MSNKHISFKNKANVRLFAPNDNETANTNRYTNIEENVKNRQTKKSKTRPGVRTVPNNIMNKYLPGRSELRSHYQTQKANLKKEHKNGKLSDRVYEFKKTQLKRQLNEELDRYAAAISGSSNTSSSGTSAITGGGGGSSVVVGGAGSTRRIHRH